MHHLLCRANSILRLVHIRGLCVLIQQIYLLFFSTQLLEFYFIFNLLYNPVVYLLNATMCLQKQSHQEICDIEK